MRAANGIHYLLDEYGNRHERVEELARAGQGVVYTTTDKDLAVKQPLVAGTDNLDDSKDYATIFQRVRTLPIPPRIALSLPLSILRDEPGYVMRLLSGMVPLGELDTKDFDRYSKTGSVKRRLYGLYKTAAILARLHSAGIVYGDVSGNNILMGEGMAAEVWLIDADNLRYEAAAGGAIFTPGLGAPEVVRGEDVGRPRSDCWAFAVLAFKVLTMGHPFIGKRVLEPDDAAGWDAEPAANGAPTDPDEQARAGYLPWIYDEDDDSNAAVAGIPPQLVLTRELMALFQETFGPGRLEPHRRPTMPLWARALARAFDSSLVCKKCFRSYFTPSFTECPYCGEPAHLHALATGLHGSKVLEFSPTGIPARMVEPFSPETGDDVRFSAELDFDTRSALPVRGTSAFPESLRFEFRGGAS
jgi:serine/threonine protein kinase